eukprot:CAMPEP_0204643604 /NCGR_PEP_ID=MMETSP0718-20130828/841_1 /ASSEMBLY_ACC=CAM_ASM_000674 /TAXON_ID=230516 /ORGANISM="Chaetoceros curvisetus" /LENGTH=117 /DNA_ID=CAMNT_0051664885 /DNA_START=745 /DNA_END=1095 /DNA_ORIENTATION=-
MREGVNHNNEACALIDRGDVDAAIALLNQALLLCSAAAAAEGMAPPKPNPSFHPAPSIIKTVGASTYHRSCQDEAHQQIHHISATRRRNGIANQPAHYYHPNDYDEGMRTFSQPLFL